MESGGFLRRGVDIGGNLRLVDLGGFPRFQFGVRAVGCKPSGIRRRIGTELISSCGGSTVPATVRGSRERGST